MGHHRAQTESVLKRSVQDIISRGLADPRVSGIVTVTRVEVSPDGRQATIWCSVMPADRSKLVKHGLMAATGRIHRELKDKLEMRRVPRLHFRIDESLKKEAEVLAAINEAKLQDEVLKQRRDGVEAPPAEGESTEDQTS